MLIRGEDIREHLAYPNADQFRADIQRHYDAIRQYAQNTSRKITSCGWLLDIARSLYTLRTNKVIAKTLAGEWAIREGIAPNAEILQKAVQVRTNPQAFINDQETLNWCGTLGFYVQEFARVLEGELS